MDWAEMVVRYMNWMRHNCGRSEATVRKYAGYLERLADWYRKPPEDEKLRPAAPGPAEATAEDLDLFTGLYAHRLGLGPRTRRPLVAALKSFYKWAHGSGSLSTNAGHRLVYPDAGRRLPVSADIESAEKMIMAPDIDTFLGLRDAALIATLIGTGVRVSGLVAMDESSLLVTHDRGQEHVDALVREKGKKERLVPVPPEAVVLIRAYLAHRELQEIDRDLDNGDRVLWVSTRNRLVAEHEYRGARRRLAPRSVNDLLDKYGEKSGVPKAQRHPHAFRHLYGTELAEGDVDLIQRQILMGHSSADSTAIYTHLARRKLRQTSDRSNPLNRMRAPIIESARELSRPRRKGKA